MSKTTIRVTVNQKEAAEIAEVFHKRLMVFGYEHDIEVVSEVGPEAQTTIETDEHGSARASDSEQEELRAARVRYAFDVVGGPT